jgi:PAS domain S-box-containing protein
MGMSTALKSTDNEGKDMNVRGDYLTEPDGLGADALWTRSPDVLCLLDPDGIVRRANPSWERVLGWRADDVVDRTLLHFVHPAALAEAMPHFAALPHGASFEARHLHADGSSRTLLWSATSELGWTWASAKDITLAAGEHARLRESTERLWEAHRAARLATWEWDPASGLVHLWTDVAAGIGLDRERTVPLREIAEVVDESHRDEVLRCLGNVLDDGREREISYPVPGQDGGPMWFQSWIRRISSDGRFLVRGTSQDVTKRRRATDEIQLQARLLDEVDTAVIAMDLDGVVTHWNAAAERMYGWAAREVIGRAVATLAGGHEPQVRAVLRTVIEAGRWEEETELPRKDGSRVRAWLRAVTLEDALGQPAGLLASSVDVTGRAEDERRLRSARDHLRAVTDNMGEGLYTLDGEGGLTHMNGAAERMLGWRMEELLGRDMHEVAHRCRPDGSPLPAGDCPIMGARGTGEEVRVDDDVFVRRDGTLLPVSYSASPFLSEDGVNGWVVVFSDISERKIRERELVRRLDALTSVGVIRDALAGDDFVLHAQPILDLRTGETVTHELLIRMVEPGGELVAPSEFLPAAEEHGLIREIDRWVVPRAVALAARGCPVELNLSAASISDPGLYRELAEEIERQGADPALLVIEVTETALIGNEDAAESFIERIGALGCSVALDDFGTGYGGFNYLKRMAVSYLKIDTEFVRDLRSNDASRHVVSAVVNLAAGFGQQTIAEGVEDEETRSLLAEMGVDFAQGYAIGGPQPVEDVFG